MSYISYYNDSNIPSQIVAGVWKLGALQVVIKALGLSVLEV